MVSKGSESDDEELAKQIFLDHKGSKFFMDRSGALDVYRQFGINREMELEWTKEQIERLLKEFASPSLETFRTYSDLVGYIRMVDDIEGLRTLLRLVRCKMTTMDTISLVVIAEMTFNLMRQTQHRELFNQRDLLQEEFSLIRDLLMYASTMESRVPCKLTKKEVILSGGQMIDRIRRNVQSLESYRFPWDYKGRIWKWLRSKIPGAKKL